MFEEDFLNLNSVPWGRFESLQDYLRLSRDICSSIRTCWYVCKCRMADCRLLKRDLLFFLTFFFGLRLIAMSVLCVRFSLGDLLKLGLFKRSGNIFWVYRFLVLNLPLCLFPVKARVSPNISRLVELDSLGRQLTSPMLLIWLTRSDPVARRSS